VAGVIRQAGGGRKRVEEQDETLIENLDHLVAPMTRGDPESPLRWTCKSVSKLAQELQQQGHQVSAKTVYTLLSPVNYIGSIRASIFSSFLLQN
jgi:hypothetical protein